MNRRRLTIAATAVGALAAIVLGMSTIPDGPGEPVPSPTPSPSATSDV